MNAEARIGAAVVAYWRDLGFATYAEVSTGYASRRYDLVACRGALVVIVECKIRLSWELLDQAMDARGAAHRVYIAVPSARSIKRSRAVDAVLDATGIGLLVVDSDGSCVETRAAAWNRKARGAARLRGELVPEMNDGVVAGQQGGGYWTPFRATIRAVESVLKERGELTTRELVDALRGGAGHHYASDTSARAALPSYAFSASILAGTGVVARRDGRAVLWNWAPPSDERCGEPNCSYFSVRCCADCEQPRCARCEHPFCRCAQCGRSKYAGRATARCATCRALICESCADPRYGTHWNLSPWCARPGIDAEVKSTS